MREPNIRYKESDILVRGLRLHLYTMGNGSPPVILAHGFTDHGPCWLRLADQLASDRRIIMYDARGHGRSEAPSEGYTRRALAEDLVALTEELELDRPVVMGHSMGADTAAWAGALAPSLFGGIILEDPPWSPALYDRSDADRADRAERETSRAITNRERDLVELEAWIQERKPHWHPTECRTWAEAKALMDPSATQVIASDRVPWRRLVPEIGCPILLLTGDNALGALTTPAVAHEVLRIGKDVQHVHVDKAGHSLRRDQFAAVLAAVRAFLVRLAEG
jgi:N-formylmaleamate deformylase